MWVIFGHSAVLPKKNGQLVSALELGTLNWYAYFIQLTTLPKECGKLNEISVVVVVVVVVVVAALNSLERGLDFLLLTQPILPLPHPSSLKQHVHTVLRREL